MRERTHLDQSIEGVNKIERTLEDAATLIELGEAEEDSEVVVQTRFSVFKPSQGGTELGLQVQPAGEEGPSRQDHHEDGTLIQLGIRLHADCVEPVIKA